MDQTNRSKTSARPQASSGEAAVIKSPDDPETYDNSRENWSQATPSTETGSAPPKSSTVPRRQAQRDDAEYTSEAARVRW